MPQTETTTEPTGTSGEQQEIVKGKWYPAMPPALDGETPESYTNRLTGYLGPDLRPYDHRRNRQCSIGYHRECSDPRGERCECPCHPEQRDAESIVLAWNERWPVGARVTFPQAPDEPPTVTVGPAEVAPWSNGFGSGQWPVVALKGFDEPVKLSWLQPVSADAEVQPADG